MKAVSDATKFTAEQKKEYFQGLRNQWKVAKDMAETAEIKAAWLEAQRTTGGTFSVASFAWVFDQMKKEELDGVPYVDAKTFQGWKKSGFSVQKGEKSNLTGIVWMEVKEVKKGEKEAEDSFMMPKVYHLFHKSQVQPIEA